MKNKSINKYQWGGAYAPSIIPQDYFKKGLMKNFESKSQWTLNSMKDFQKITAPPTPPVSNSITGSITTPSMTYKNGLTTNLIKKRDVGPKLQFVDTSGIDGKLNAPITMGSNETTGTTVKPKLTSEQKWEKANKTANIIGSAADAIPRRQVEDPTISGLNSAYDATSNAIAAVPVVGTIISAGMKVIKGAESVIDSATGGDFGIKSSGKGGFWGQYNKMGDSTWALLTPTGWINRFTKKKVEGSDTSLAQSINRGYKPTEATQQEDIGGVAQSLGKAFGGRNLIQEAKQRTARVNLENLKKSSVVYKDTQNQLAAQNSFSDILSKTQQQLFGGQNTRMLAAKKGAKINPAKLRNLCYNIKVEIPEVEIPQFAEGGQLNVIPEGALHARKHNLPEDIKDQVTNKGIPVITYDEGGDITQHAEIEVNEIIFAKQTTEKLEEYFKKYNESDSEETKSKIAIECGKFLASEILENTDDKTGLIDTIE